jgi:hypothetical protein
MVDRRPRMRRSHRNTFVLILTRGNGCMDESNCFEPLVGLGFLQKRDIVAVLSQSFFPERHLSPTSASHRPGCCQKTTPELHFCSGAAIGSHHSSLPNCFPFIPSLFWLNADFFGSGFGGGRGKGLA